MEKLQVYIEKHKTLKDFNIAEYPAYATKYSSGVDLRANLELFYINNKDNVTVVKQNVLELEDNKYEYYRKSFDWLLCRHKEQPSLHELHLYSGKTILIPTGIKIAIPVGYEGQVRGRSGLALKQSLIVTNSPGTIDSDYRGDVGIILTNLSDKSIVIHNFDRMAQLVFTKVEQATFKEMELTGTQRGDGGFGSTGLK